MIATVVWPTGNPTAVSPASERCPGAARSPSFVLCDFKRSRVSPRPVDKHSPSLNRREESKLIRVVLELSRNCAIVLPIVFVLFSYLPRRLTPPGLARFRAPLLGMRDFIRLDLLNVWLYEGTTSYLQGKLSTAPVDKPPSVAHRTKPGTRGEENQKGAGEHPLPSAVGTTLWSSEDDLFNPRARCSSRGYSSIVPTISRLFQPLASPSTDMPP